jgi:hypothetical protein
MKEEEWHEMANNGINNEMSKIVAKISMAE